MWEAMECFGCTEFKVTRLSQQLIKQAVMSTASAQVKSESGRKVEVAGHELAVTGIFHYTTASLDGMRGRYHPVAFR